ncbi:type II secretion system F family protein [Paeniglutamicibacter sp. MACA_103]|uniref:type II secretion system F family protein n=1 Tax=Paeniglutamicibacter sp. MACA_103 TaxID=3377337 RepID=UPI003895C062
MVSLACAVVALGTATWLWLAPGNTHRKPPAAGARPDRVRRHRTNLAADAEDYAKLIRQLAALLRAGTSPAAAFGLLETLWAAGSTRTASDIHTGCTRALAQWRTGGTLQEGLAAHAVASPGHGRLWNRLAWCFAISQESGAALADLLDTLAEEAETAADMHRALQAALAGPRATSRLLTYLPGIGLGLGQLLGINPLAVLTTHSVGRVALVCGVCLWLGNRYWCARMLRAISNKVPS